MKVAFWGFWQLSFESVNSWERAMPEIFTPATQPLCQSGWRSHSATQPLTEWLSGCSSHSGRVAGAWVARPATLAEWLSGCSTHSGRATLSGWVAEWLSGCSSHSGRVAEWLSGCSSYSGRVAEWLIQPLWQSGWVAPPATVAERLSGWVAAAESSANEMDKVFKHFNIQTRLYGVVLNPLEGNLVEALLWWFCRAKTHDFSREGARRRKGERKVV